MPVFFAGFPASSLFQTVNLSSVLARKHGLLLVRHSLSMWFSLYHTVPKSWKFSILGQYFNFLDISIEIHFNLKPIPEMEQVMDEPVPTGAVLKQFYLFFDTPQCSPLSYVLLLFRDKTVATGGGKGDIFPAESGEVRRRNAGEKSGGSLDKGAVFSYTYACHVI
ncbi:MAG: hypothetical protein ACOX7N_02120 [Lawsonibacter sp.]|jgi:hypothetical protein